MEDLNYTANCSASVTAINCFGDENTSVVNFTEGRVYYIRLVTVSVISLQLGVVFHQLQYTCVLWTIAVQKKVWKFHFSAAMAIVQAIQSH